MNIYIGLIGPYISALLREQCFRFRPYKESGNYREFPNQKQHP